MKRRIKKDIVLILLGGCRCRNPLSFADERAGEKQPLY